ncbi:cilia- and flagella-associated protein 119 [Polymixia lowei]
MLWADVSYNDMEEIDQMQSVPDLESALCNIFRVDVPEPRRGVLLELYVQTVLFCRRSSFNREQTSALLSVVKCVHQANIETSLNNMEQCFQYCSDLLLCHSVRRPPFSINIFNSEEVTQILKYIHTTYIRHYNLYKYIFTPQVRLDLSLTYYGMPEEDEPTTEDAVSPEVEKVMENESGAEEERDMSAEAQEPQARCPDAAPLDSRSELKAMIQQVVGEEMMRVSVQLDQRLKESTDQLNNALTSLQFSSKGKNDAVSLYFLVFVLI